MKHLLKVRTAATAAIRRALLISLLGGVAFGLAACNADDGSRSKAAVGHSVGFGMDNVASRAMPTTALKKFGVFGYSHQGDYASTVSVLIPDYFLNRTVLDPTGTGKWNYPGVVRYWPTDGTTLLSFFAYAPYIDVEDTFVLRPQAISDVMMPTIEYTVPSDIKNQIDLMWSNAFDQEYTTNTTNNGVVEFTMNHALTKLNFAVQLAKAEAGRPFMVEIKELALNNIVGTGTLNLEKVQGDPNLWSLAYPGNDSYVLTPTTGMASVTLDATDIDAILDAADPGATVGSKRKYIELLDGGHSLMLIPQILKDQNNGELPPEVVVKYSYINTYSGETIDGEAILPLSVAALDTWTAGQGVNYKLTISLLEGTVVEFDIEALIDYTPWVNGGEIEGEIN